MADGVDKPLLKEQWAGAVDTVGGDILFNVVKSLQYGGSVACGLTAGAGFKASVLPFILRGVNLLGVDSVELPLVVKASMWDKLSLQWKLDNLEEVAREIALEELPGRSTRSSPASWSAGCWSTSAGVAGAQLRQQVARP